MVHVCANSVHGTFVVTSRVAAVRERERECASSPRVDGSIDRARDAWRDRTNDLHRARSRKRSTRTGDARKRERIVSS